jgi:hypothetical protein
VALVEPTAHPSDGEHAGRIGRTRRQRLAWRRRCVWRRNREEQSVPKRVGCSDAISISGRRETCSARCVASLEFDRRSFLLAWPPPGAITDSSSCPSKTGWSCERPHSPIPGFAPASTALREAPISRLASARRFPRIRTRLFEIDLSRFQSSPDSAPHLPASGIGAPAPSSLAWPSPGACTEIISSAFGHHVPKP